MTPRFGKVLVIGACAFLGLTLGANQARAAIKIGVVLADTNRGTMVEGVYRGSVAREKMGLRAGDILLTVNGQDVRSAAQFATVLSRTNSIRLSWLHNGRVYRGWASKRVVTGGDEGGGEVTVGGEGESEDYR